LGERHLHCIIETVSGRSEKILQKGIDPDRWIYRWGKLLEKPEKSRINEKIISKIAAASKYLEVKIGSPLDLEWVYYNDQVWWIQLREITTIDEHDFFSNKLINNRC